MFAMLMCCIAWIKCYSERDERGAFHTSSEGTGLNSRSPKLLMIHDRVLGFTCFICAFIFILIGTS